MERTDAIRAIAHYCREFITDFGIRADLVFIRAAHDGCSFASVDYSLCQEIEEKIDEWREDYDPAGEFEDLTADDIIWQM